MTGPEQRHSPRHWASGATWWSQAGETRPRGAWVLERSATGVAFVTRADTVPVPGAQVELAASADDPGVRARVCRMRRAHWDLFVIAAMFEGASDPDAARRDRTGTRGGT